MTPDEALAAAAQHRVVDRGDEQAAILEGIERCRHEWQLETRAHGAGPPLTERDTHFVGHHDHASRASGSRSLGACALQLFKPGQAERDSTQSSQEMPSRRHHYSSVLA